MTEKPVQRRNSIRSRKNKWKCWLCSSPDVHIALPAWFVEDDAGVLTYLDTDFEAAVLFWYCTSCGMTQQGTPSKNDGTEHPEAIRPERTRPGL